jgi:hypothetical protein
MFAVTYCISEVEERWTMFEVTHRPIEVGIAAGIAAPSLAVQQLFPLPVLLADILNFSSLPSSTKVNQRRLTSGLSSVSRPGVVENVGAACGIASQSTTVQKLFPAPV